MTVHLILVRNDCWESPAFQLVHRIKFPMIKKRSASFAPLAVRDLKEKAWLVVQMCMMDSDGGQFACFFCRDFGTTSIMTTTCGTICILHSMLRKFMRKSALFCKNMFMIRCAKSVCVYLCILFEWMGSDLFFLTIPLDA